MKEEIRHTMEKRVLKSDYDYDLPPELIAQTPAVPRDSARLMTVDRRTGAVGGHLFSELPHLLKPGDLLVVNNSKVIPARLLGKKKKTGADCELLILHPSAGSEDTWECLAKPGRRMQPGTEVEFGRGLLTAEILETTAEGNKIVSFAHPSCSFMEAVDRLGHMPLPHYIKKEPADGSQYQTVYAKDPGSVAAPTAGLHFTPQLLDTLAEMGIGRAEITLHVGIGTFRPVKVDDITKHHMHTEWYSIDAKAAEQINAAKSAGHRVIAVGTTSCRTLESAWKRYGAIRACSGNTDIFIYPGFEFGVLDGLITNFHLPESTLIMLVSAFAGYENTMNAYQVAVQQRYRFFSFGDAMLIL